MPPGVLAHEQLGGRSCVGQREAAGDGDDEVPRSSQLHEIRAHRRAVGLAGRHRASKGDQTLLLGPIRGGNGDDASTIVDQGEGHLDRLVGADAVERGSHPLRHRIAHPPLEPVPVAHRHATEAGHDVVVRRAGRADHPRPDSGGLLEHTHADRSGRAVHQDRVAPSHVGDVQHLGGGRPREQEVGRLAEGERPGLGEDVGCRDGDVGGPTATDAEREDLIAHRHRT